MEEKELVDQAVEDNYELGNGMRRRSGNGDGVEVEGSGTI